MPIVMVESFTEFCEKHGGEYVTARGWLLFPDGSSCDESFTIRREPPRSEHDRLNLQREFLQIKLKEAEKAFRDAKNVALQQAAHARSGTVPEPHADTPRVLAKRRDDILALRKRIAEFDELISATPEAQKQRAREAAENERQQRLAALASEIEQVEI